MYNRKFRYQQKLNIQRRIEFEEQVLMIKGNIFVEFDPSYYILNDSDMIFYNENFQKYAPTRSMKIIKENNKYLIEVLGRRYDKIS